MTEKIKYGILGCGKHSLHSHAIPGKEIEELELTSLYDVSIDQMIGFEEKIELDLDKYLDLNEFLDSDIDAVLIGSPDEYHFSNLKDVIKSEKHVFVEKPLATTTEEVEELKDVLFDAKDKNLIVSSCHPRRFDPPFLWLKENLSEWKSKFGKPNSFHFDFSYHKPSKEWKHDRGLLLDHLNHEIDLMNFLFGNEYFTSHKLKDSYDSYHVTGKRDDGISFNFEGTRKLLTKTYPEFARIRFDRGEVTLDCHRGTAQIHDHSSYIISISNVPRTDYELRGRRTLENFVDAINLQEFCYLGPDDLYVNTAMSVYLTYQDGFKFEKK